MACCLGSTEDREAMKNSKKVEKMMKMDNENENLKIKLLLLGAGESGKSTIFKQMRVLYGAKLTEEEKQQVTPVVYSNTIASMKILAQATVNFEYEKDIEPKNKEHFQAILDVDEGSDINTEIGTAIKALWKDPGIRLAWDRRSEYHIIESVKYYFNEIDRIIGDEYIASQQDMLLARVRTSGIVTERYIIDGANFEMYDVGGQRNERKKWIHCFDDVTAVIFVAALSEYDQVLFEDASTNRMVEAVDLFSDICNNRYFTNSSMILFLNKKDLFEDKIKRVDINDQEEFKDFTGKFGSDEYYDDSVKYFLDKFVDQNQNPDRIIYNHVTCATDSGNVAAVFNACKDIILRDNLADSGFMN
mmetsp:Transcript_59240/g.69269  ORF Transcript_59240/g.69269 Transcript_59240/m.69269 type:complete len:360 (+) Transcript_59240:134-1213(+)